ncbi:MAG: hypothetical protein WCV82_03845 [Candidatus Paceibacterota bacterium]
MKKPRLDFRALNQILVEGATKDQKILRRELGILKRLRARYQPLEFWVSLKPAIRLGSLSYFLTDYGARSLQEEWNAYQIGEAQRKAEEAAALDKDIRHLEDQLEPEIGTISIDTERNTNTVNRKQSVLEWADTP